MKYVTTQLKRYKYLQLSAQLTLMLLLSPLWLVAVIGEGANMAIRLAADQCSSFVRWIAYKLDWESEAIRQREINPNKFKL